MKKYSLALLIIFIALTVRSVEQEFLKPKSKKQYPSVQQMAELDADVAVQGTASSASLVNLLKKNVEIVQRSMSRVDGYANGEKSTYTKIQRADIYEQTMKIKSKIESINQKTTLLHEQLTQLDDELANALNSN